MTNRSAPDSAPPPRVFVVDDERQICTLLQRVLSREGYEVEAFHSPEDALTAMRARAPSLLVTDLMMPGMSGLELISRARAHAPHMGTIVITGYASIENVVGALRSGVDDFVTKPFSVAEIQTVAARLLEVHANRVAAAARTTAPSVTAETASEITPALPAATSAKISERDDAPATAVERTPTDQTPRKTVRIMPPVSAENEAAAIAAAASTESTSGSGESPPRPRTGIGFPATSFPEQSDSPVLARRLSEMSLSERLHGLLAEDFTSDALIHRCAELLRSAFHISHAALLIPEGREGGFVVLGATAPRATDDGPAFEIQPGEPDFGALEAVATSGQPAAIEAASANALADRLDRGPLAAAALSPRAPQTIDSGVLVVARPIGAAAFDPSELRRLGSAAVALGAVFRALRTAERAEEAYLDSLTAIVAATENRTPWFARHSERVRRLSLELGRAVGLAERDLDLVDCAARVLDLGRVEIPDELLTKAGALSAADWRVLRRHVAVADTLLRPVGRLRRVKPVVRHHHENWDGSGYPDGLRGDEIPYLAALVRVTDAYAALTSPRAWRPALADADARNKIRELAGRHFHPEIAQVFADDVPAEAASE